MRSWLSVLITDAESKKVFDIPIAPSLYSLSNKMDNSLLAVRDINHKYIVVENNIKLDTSITNIEVGNYIKALGLNGNIIYENNNKVFMQNVMINKVELNIRVHVYNKTNADITIEQLVAGLDEKNSNEVKVLDEYTKWFKSPDDVGMAGKSKVEEYLGDLRSIMQNYANEHPEIKLTNLESLSEEQLRELIKKKENSWYVIKDSIMED